MFWPNYLFSVLTVSLVDLGKQLLEAAKRLICICFQSRSCLWLTLGSDCWRLLREGRQKRSEHSCQMVLPSQQTGYVVI